MGSRTRRSAQAPRARGISAESCRDGGAKDHAVAFGAAVGTGVRGAVGTVTVSCVSGSVVGTGLVGTAARAGAAAARWAPTALVGTA
ncbi:hypothetical protein HMPREF1549_01681, partial [Actinomyces johnsonii F0510]